MTHVRVWMFRPPRDREEEFADVYSGTGRWAELFGRASGYAGTTLLRPHETGGCWLTLDRWQSASHFQAFQQQFEDEYRELDSALEGLAGEEEFIGAFEVEG